MRAWNPVVVNCRHSCESAGGNIRADKSKLLLFSLASIPTHPPPRLPPSTLIEVLLVKRVTDCEREEGNEGGHPRPWEDGRMDVGARRPSEFETGVRDEGNWRKESRADDAVVDVKCLTQARTVRTELTQWPEGSSWLAQ